MIELSGTILTAEGQTDRLWVSDGVISRVPGPEVTERVEGFILPGLADAHCHIGLGSPGPIDRQTALDQARRVLASG